MFVKLTALNYKVKLEALERYHNISEFNEERKVKWEESMRLASLSDEDSYIPKPFIEPNEFNETDYNITDRPIRVKKSTIGYYNTNIEG